MVYKATEIAFMDSKVEGEAGAGEARRTHKCIGREFLDGYVSETLRAGAWAGLTEQCLQGLKGRVRQEDLQLGGFSSSELEKLCQGVQPSRSEVSYDQGLDAVQ